MSDRQRSPGRGGFGRGSGRGGGDRGRGEYVLRTEALANFMSVLGRGGSFGFGNRGGFSRGGQDRGRGGFRGGSRGGNFGGRQDRGRGGHRGGGNFADTSEYACELVSRHILCIN